MSLIYVNYFDSVQVTCEKQHKLYMKCKIGKFLANEILLVFFFNIIFMLCKYYKITYSDVNTE